MLTDKQKIDLLDTAKTPDHLHEFIRKWINADDGPKHFQHILEQFAQLNHAELKKYYIVRDQLYYLDYTPEKLVKHSIQGWKTARSYVISRKK